MASNTTSPPTVLPIFATRQQVTAALERSAERARIIAEQTGTQLIVVPTESPQTQVPVVSKKS